MPAIYRHILLVTPPLFGLSWIATYPRTRPDSRSTPGGWRGSTRRTAFKKKIYRYRPGSERPIEARASQTRTKPVPCDPRSIEHGVRQFLADKAAGNLAGIWLLVPELLR